MKIISEYCKNLGSTEPTPGGGSAAGVVLSLSASCAEKAARFSIHDHLEKYIESFVEIREAGLKLSDEDEAAFLGWKKARELPKSTDKEKKDRIDLINLYVEQCVLVPFTIAEKALYLSEVILDFVPFCNKWLISDLQISASFAQAAFDSAIYNITINLPYLKDEKLLKKSKGFINTNKKYLPKLYKNIIKSCQLRLKN
ncbi:MAG TPA: cyclodeaminase/cyclohydrolase family protein [Spirochaetota bacterium]|nr:cyclodeaminase/cyclohydrolase family protein [Spirochaetota bacterium]HOS32104.1 cyclodeaminase/cyclohydrolase family protein [Spirochaetota bacterium]HOS55445.1 cyclodeaminase/cyclohydrolase family protein [Spirochaetota bacterium]HPK60847.1 cyclodeaminase/cyclohydrolase family protein [Spirochaetota bacterium]HQF77995.1 cyclodeaminase/cyclohydrolase family protein [Spirochaetota bacterium]